MELYLQITKMFTISYVIKNKEIAMRQNKPRQLLQRHSKFIIHEAFCHSTLCGYEVLAADLNKL
jgi:hypothetical protein